MRLRSRYGLLFVMFLLAGEALAQGPAVPPTAPAAVVDDAALDAFLDHIRLDAALIVDQNDTLRRKLAQDPQLRETLRNLNHLPADQLDLVNALNTRYPPSGGRNPIPLWEQEYERFVAVQRGEFSSENQQAIRRWTDGIVSTWSPGARRRIVAKVMAVRKDHRARTVDARQRAGGAAEREVTLREQARQEEGLHQEAAARAAAYREEHASWSADDWRSFGVTTLVGAAVGGAVVGGVGRLVTGTLRSPGVGRAAAVGAVLLAGIVAFIKSSSMAHDRDAGIARLDQAARTHADKAKNLQQQADQAATEARTQGERAVTEREEAVWSDGLLDVIPQGRRWDQEPEPPASGEEPGFGDLERTGR